LNLCCAVANRKSHCLCSIEQRTICHTNDIAGYDLILVVAVRLVSCCLHSCVDLINCNLSVNNCCQDCCRSCRSRNTLSGSDQFSVQFRNNKTDCFSSTCAVRNDVDSCST